MVSSGKKIRRGLVHTSVVSAFACLTALMTYPLVFRLAESVPGWAGDNLHYVRLIWWFKRAIVDLRISPTFNPLVYAPKGMDLAHAEMTWANALLALPLTTLWGPVVAYNGMLLLSFVLTGFATYLWVWRLTGSPAAGFVAGIVLAFCPYRMAHFAGHLPLMPTQWLPFLLYILEESARTRRLRFAALGGLLFGLNAWSSWYYFYFSLLVVPLYVLARGREWRSRAGSLTAWREAAIFTAVAVGMILPAAWPYLRLHGTGTMQHSFSVVDSWAANPSDFVVPNVLHPLWGEAVRDMVSLRGRLWVERSLYLGLIPMLLALVALTARREDQAVRALVCLTLSALVFALGPTLHWAGNRVYVSVPPGVMAILYHLGITPYLAPRLGRALLEDMQLNHYVFIPLPMLLFYLLVPFTASMRVVARFGIVAGLGVAGLAGRGVALLEERWAGHTIRRALSTGVVVAGILFEFWSLPYEMTDLRPRAVDLWLAGQPAGVMVELPVAHGIDPLSDYYATVHGQATVFGPTAVTFVPSALPERLDRLGSFPDVESLSALEEYGVTTVVVHTEALDDWPSRIEPWQSTGQLRPVRCFDMLCVYSLGLSK